jgi:hypothetical protein
VWDLHSNAGIIDGGGANDILVIHGTLRKSAGIGTSTVSTFVNNAGLVEVQSGTLSLTGTVRQVSGNVLKGGSWAAFSSSTGHAALSLGSAKLTTIGVGTNVFLSGPNASFGNLAGLSLVQGSFSLLAGGSFTTAGDLTSTGVLTLAPGSTLTVGGSFTQKATAILSLQLGGATSGRISVNHKVMLAGALRLSWIVKPFLHQVFTILHSQGNSPVSGTFAGLKEGAIFVVGGLKFKISYAAGKGRSVALMRIS